MTRSIRPDMNIPVPRSVEARIQKLELILQTISARSSMGLGLPTRIRRNGALTVSATGSQSILADVVDFDPGNYASNASGRYQYICPVDGYYMVSGEILISTVAASFFVAQVWKNGTTATTGTQHQTATTATVSYGANVTDILRCSAGDALEAAFSVGALATTSLNAGSTVRNFLTVAQWSGLS